MNRFLNKKKASEPVSANAEAYNALTSPPPTPGLKKSATSRWRKPKQQSEPTTPQLDIAAALPMTDDFRTSLLMPNLSARFSMLREQDDPTSLLGKASDDSVLQPRRRSRMLDFGFGSNGLNDIAEVQSINSSIKPPFTYERQESYGSVEGYGSEAEENGSMMSRARPGEGNVLFGGRQKVYRIATSGATSARSLGRPVYEDDIGISAFQKHKQAEKDALEGRRSEDDQGFDFGLEQPDSHMHESKHDSTPNDSAKDLSHSPSLSSYDKKRSTTSSITRSEARSSTAATSIASQPVVNAPSPLAIASQGPIQVASTPSSLKRSDTKTRRLYEQGLDQHIHEQQTSALTRLNSIQRQRTLNNGKQAPPYLPSAKSTGNIHDRSAHHVYTTRAQSPPPMAPLTTFSSMTNLDANGGSPMTSGPQSPTSPHALEFDDVGVLTQAIEPGDRGKATAMGAFNKPKAQFDEQQYLARQQQLQRSKSNGGAFPTRSQSSAGGRKDSAAQAAMHQRIGRYESVERERSASAASTRSRSGSAPKRHEPSKAYNVFQRAASQLPAQPGAQQQYDAHRTFFGNISGSDSEDDGDEDERSDQVHSPSDYSYGGQSGRWQPTLLPSVSEHPAMRAQSRIIEEDEELEHPAMRAQSRIIEEDEELEHPALRTESRMTDRVEELEPRPLRPMPSSQSITFQPQTDRDGIDSPTLGPSSSEPLNSMMHHLRQKSNQSSIYPMDEGMADDEVPDLPSWNTRNLDLDTQGIRSTIGSDSRIASTYTNSNPWDLDDIDNTYYGRDDNDDASNSISPVESTLPRTTYGSRAPSRQAAAADRQSGFSQPLNRQSEVSQAPSRQSEVPQTLARHSEVSQASAGATPDTWQSQLRQQHGHTRDASTATQQERDAFENELAARQLAIRENIKSIVERDTHSRGVSPAPSASGAFKAAAFGMIRSKSSRESVDVIRQPISAPTKAMKMLGIGSLASASNSNLNGQAERGGYSLDVSRPRNNSASRPPLPTIPAHAPPQSEFEASRARGDSEASRMGGRHPANRSPPQTSDGRSRSNSQATTGRARSRTGPYRDDLEKAMKEGTGTSASGVPEISPLIARELTPRPSPDGNMQSSFDDQPRTRSNSRAAAMTNYFDSKAMQPAQGSQNVRSPSVGPPPVTLSPMVYSPPNTFTRSPIQAPTPPISGANTPQASHFTTPIMQSSQGRPNGVLRKKTISKSEISEPTLISSTSNVDTVALPEGASLKNGMSPPSSPAPPVPALNPRRMRGGSAAARRIFGIGRSPSGGVQETQPSYNYGRSKTPEPWMTTPMSPPREPYEMGRGIRNNTTDGLTSSRLGLVPKQVAGFESRSTSALQHFDFTPSAGSPEKLKRSPPVEGGMF